MKLTPLFFISMFLLLILQTSCEKDLETKPVFKETFLEYKETLTIQFESPVSIGFPIPWIPISLNDSASGRVADPLVQVVENIQLKTMMITMEEATGTSNKTFDFLKHLDISISKGNLPKVKIAHATNISDNIGDVLYLTPEKDVVIDDYVKNGDYDIHMDIDTKYAPSLGTLTLRADMIFDVRLINAQ